MDDKDKEEVHCPVAWLFPEIFADMVDALKRRVPCYRIKGMEQQLAEKAGELVLQIIAMTDESDSEYKVEEWMRNDDAEEISTIIVLADDGTSTDKEMRWHLNYLFIDSTAKNHAINLFIVRSRQKERKK